MVDSTTGALFVDERIRSWFRNEVAESSRISSMICRCRFEVAKWIRKRRKMITDEKHLEEKHVTWARFRKKLDKNTTFQARDFHSDVFTKSAQKVKFLIKSVTSESVKTAYGFYLDAVRINM
ncbi:hypothetical protein Tco_1537992 [Tanacetum coccineum]